jgi:RNase P subunit RPR2
MDGNESMEANQPIPLSDITTPTEPTERIKTTAELVGIQMPIIRFKCPKCETPGFIPGPPIGQPERIRVFAQGKILLLKCGKCGSMLELEQQLIASVETVAPRNRHEKRAQEKGVKLGRVK